jgi:hypothetical protein
MPDYQNGKIYKIVNYENDDVYIGSTTEPTLARRLAKHVGNYREYLNGKFHYLTSFKVIETGNYDIQLIEKYPCNSKMELHAREGYYIKSVDCINKRVAGRTRKQYEQDNKDVIAKKNKAYKTDKKQKINMKHSCLCGGKYTHTNMAVHMRSKKHQSYINSIEFYQDVYDMVKSIVNKFPRSI